MASRTRVGARESVWTRHQLIQTGARSPAAACERDFEFPCAYWRIDDNKQVIVARKCSTVSLEVNCETGFEKLWLWVPLLRMRKVVSCRPFLCE